jgi:hypothetical protein
MRRPALLALLAACLYPAPARARHVAPRDNALGLSLTVGGAVVAAIGAVVLGRGFTIAAGPSCPAWPQTFDVCDGVASDYRAGGATLLGIGVGAALAGGVSLGVMR